MRTGIGGPPKLAHDFYHRVVIATTFIDGGGGQALAAAMPKQPSKTVLGVRFDPSTMAALTRAAGAEDRSLSSLCREIVKTWLAANHWTGVSPGGPCPETQDESVASNALPERQPL